MNLARNADGEFGKGGGGGGDGERGGESSCGVEAGEEAPEEVNVGEGRRAEELREEALGEETLPDLDLEDDFPEGADGGDGGRGAAEVEEERDDGSIIRRRLEVDAEVEASLARRDVVLSLSDSSSFRFPLEVALDGVSFVLIETDFPGLVERDAKGFFDPLDDDDEPADMAGDGALTAGGSGDADRRSDIPRPPFVDELPPGVRAGEDILRREG